MLTEKPILFSGPMIRAILAGQKTMTRRVVTPMAGEQAEWLTLEGIRNSPLLTITLTKERNGLDVIGAQMKHPGGGPLGWVRCPYSADRLWVRETWGVGNWNPIDRTDIAIMYGADNSSAWLGHRCPLSAAEIDAFARRFGRPSWKRSPWKPSIHMPRWASRLTLGVTGIRVERLHDISEEDVAAEGLTRWSVAELTGNDASAHADIPELLWRDAWTAINGADSWDADPWVWVVSFSEVKS